MAQATLQSFLRELHENCNLLKEREASYANAAPIYLLNQLRDYEIAIERTTHGLKDGLSLNDLQAEFNILNLELRDRVVFVSLEPPRRPFTGQNPYRGLEKFTENEAKFFFGRTAAIQNLLGLVQRLVETETGSEAPDLIAVLGASGSGKSSLVRAGLIPALGRGEVKGSERWPLRVLRPGPNPLDALAQQLVGLTRRGLASLLDDLRSGPRFLHLLIGEALANQPDDVRLVLVIDQFEELFTLTGDETERRAFIDLLLYAAQHRDSRGFILLTMRGPIFTTKPPVTPTWPRSSPATRCWSARWPRRNCAKRSSCPPRRLAWNWKKTWPKPWCKIPWTPPAHCPCSNTPSSNCFIARNGTLLTLAAYQEIGGVKGALIHRADSVLAGLTREQQVARNIFLRLTALGEGVGDTRRRVNRIELYPAGLAAAQVEAVLQALTGEKARLVVADEATVEVTHEALIQQWGRLRAWLEENREALRTQRRLTEAAVEWVANGRDPGYLYTGARLAEAEEWVQSQIAEMTELEQAFLTASVAEREREVRGQRRRTQRIMAGLAVGLVLIAIAAVFGFYGQSRAERQAQIALAQSLAALALRTNNDDELTTLLALEALEIDRQVQGSGRWLIDSALRDTLAQPYFNTTLSGHEDAVSSVAFSPDGKWLASGSWDNTVRLWQVSQPEAEPVVLSGHEDGVWSVAFSPDGAWLASGSGDTTVRLWQVNQPEAEPVILRGHEGGVLTVAFSPDGAWLASGSNDRMVRLWHQIDTLAEIGCRYVRRNLSRAEWNRYMPPGRAYHRTCPNLPVHPSVLAGQE